MNVEDIRLINFRNYNSINLKLNKKINIFVGRNAQGKTNLMEAIYMCSMGKSFRSNRDKEIVNHFKNEGYIGANINLGNYSRFIEIKLDKEKTKIIRINKNELTNYKELYGGLNVVVFTPENLKIVKDGPQERRNLMDDGISKIRPVYNYNLNKYKKILIQRNNLLKSSRFKNNVVELLDIFDMQIAKIGTSIILERNKYLNQLAKEAKNIHSQITRGAENLNLKYVSNVPIQTNKESMEESYLKLLKKNINRDIEYGTTEIGPHRDDICMDINDIDVRTYGSQGQQRTVVLSIVLSEVNLIKIERGMYPVLILDDVFSELDEYRKKYLISLFKNMQTFITTTDFEDLKLLEEFDKDIFHIENGNLKTGKDVK